MRRPEVCPRKKVPGQGGKTKGSGTKLDIMMSKGSNQGSGNKKKCGSKEGAGGGKGPTSLCIASGEKGA